MHLAQKTVYSRCSEQGCALGCIVPTARVELLDEAYRVDRPKALDKRGKPCAPQFIGSSIWCSHQ